MLLITPNHTNPYATPPTPHPTGTLCQAIWPFFNIYSLAASSVFSIPFWRHFIAWLGSVEATPGNFRRILKKGSVAVIVGGIAEMYMQVCVRG